MNTPNLPARDHLLGYLLNAVESDEREAIERQLQSDPQLCEQLEVLRRSLHPLADDAGHHAPPLGLARRCCDFVRSRTDIMPVALSPARQGSGAAERRRWSWLDICVAGTIAVAVAILLVPAIYQSHIQSQLLACQKNLQDIGDALASYTEHNSSYYPAPDADDRLNVAGMWGPIMVTKHYLPQGKLFVCPSSPTSDDVQFRIPSTDELLKMDQKQLSVWLPRLCGSYGFTLGYRANGAYKVQRHSQRQYFAVVADAPNEAGSASPNHGLRGQNVLFDDGHVQRLITVYLGTIDENIFRNSHGQIAPGDFSDDAVIVNSQVPAHF
ncbi:MAG TPA: hypothetical protein VGJ15_02475 [Pirellulales bacterium]|jgi:hypothetical protein